MTVEPHWTAYLTAIFTPIVAGFGIWIAYKQAKTARNKLKLDLFDRRFSIYEATCHFVGRALSQKILTPEDNLNFLNSSAHARWLTTQEIAEFLRIEIWNKVAELHAIETELDGVGPSEERSRLVAERRALRDHLMKQLDELEKRFRPFMTLET